MKINDKLKMPRFWFVALLVYLGIIFALSHISAADLLIIRLPIWDKSIHFFEYLPVGFMVTGLLCAKFPGSKTTVILPAVMALSLLLGGLDELHQAFVPGRQVSLGDAIADVLGGTVGAVLALHVLKSTVNRIDITTALQTGSKRQP